MSVSTRPVVRAGVDVYGIFCARRWMLMAGLTLSCAALFHIFTIRGGHAWGDDFAQYLQHAKNIAALRPYAETGYLYNPQNAIVGPRSYPPGFPTALAPVVGLFGIDFLALKLTNIIFFFVAIMIIARLFSRDLADYELWICVTILAFTPVFWEFKDIIASENLFIPLWFATLLVADSWYRRGHVIQSHGIHGLILGGLVFVTCATRTVGIVLLPAIAVSEIMIARRMTKVGMVAIITAVCLLGFQRIGMPTSGSGYGEQLRDISSKTLLSNLYSDTTAFSLIWQNGIWNGLRKFAGIVLAGFAMVGFVKANWPRPTVLCIAAVGYFVLVVTWPSADGLRMIVPLIPAFVLWALQGLDLLKSRLWKAHWGATSLLAFSLASFMTYYANADFGPLTHGVETAAAQELFDFVRRETSPDEVCLFYKPRALSLYSGCRASPFPLGIDEENFWNYAADIDARLLIVRVNASQFISQEQTCELTLPFAEQGLQEIFRNSSFCVYDLNNSRAMIEIGATSK